MLNNTVKTIMTKFSLYENYELESVLYYYKKL